MLEHVASIIFNLPKLLDMKFLPCGTGFLKINSPLKAWLCISVVVQTGLHGCCEDVCADATSSKCIKKNPACF